MSLVLPACIVSAATLGSWPVPTAELNNHRHMPLVGIGTASRLDSESIYNALHAGFRLIDSAQAEEWYSETEAARGLKKFIEVDGGRREDVWITTKIHPRNIGYERTMQAFPRSLRVFDTDYIDLVLLHYPRCWPGLCGHEHVETGTFVDTWRALEDLVERGSIKSIGVSNFGVHELQQLVDAAKIKPSVVQHWMDPFHQDRTVRNFCTENNIHYTSYSTLGNQWQYRSEWGMHGNPIFVSDVISDIAKKMEWSNVQVVLAWALQQGVSVVPRAARLEHIAANAQLFAFDESGGDLLPIGKLDQSDIEAINMLDGQLPKDVPKPKPKPKQATSGKKKVKVDAKITNKLSEKLDLFWLDLKRHEELLFAAVDAGETKSFKTFVGHNFAITNHGVIREEFSIESSSPEQHFVLTLDGISSTDARSEL